jgi:hypothetical protein
VSQTLLPYGNHEHMLGMLFDSTHDFRFGDHPVRELARLLQRAKESKGKSLRD